MSIHQPLDYCKLLNQPNICQMPIFDNCHDICHMFSYLSTPRSLYGSKDMNTSTSSLAIACGDKPAHRCYDHVRVVARTVSRTDTRTENPWTYLLHPPNTSFLTFPFTFLPSAKKQWMEKIKNQQPMYTNQLHDQTLSLVHFIVASFRNQIY